MELPIGPWILDITSLELNLCFLISSLKKPRLPLAWWGWFGKACRFWGIHISTMLLPLARAVCHIHVPNQQHKPTSGFPRMAVQHSKSLLSYVLWQFPTRSRLQLAKGTALLMDIYRSPMKLLKGMSLFLLSKFLMNWYRRDLKYLKAVL